VNQQDRDEHHGASNAGGNEADDAKSGAVSHDGRIPCSWGHVVADICYQIHSILVSVPKQSVHLWPGCNGRRA
jgi:hypothetical protein